MGKLYVEICEGGGAPRENPFTPRFRGIHTTIQLFIYTIVQETLRNISSLQNDQIRDIVTRKVRST